jgi:hypothetical protein
VAITAEVTNVSGRVITVAYGHGGFTVSLDIRRSDGKPLPLPPYVGPDAKWSDNFQLETIPAGWKQAKTLDAVPLPVESCELVIQVVLASHGPYFHYDKGEKLPVEAWSGEVKSEEAHIQIVEPSGVDKAAYDYFKGSPLSKPQDLLAKFPASTYAAYAFAQQFGYPVSVPPLDKERMCRYLDKLQKDGRAELQDTTRHIATGPDGKELRDARGKPVPLTQGEWLKQTIDLADRISSTHPELPVSEWIRSQIIASYYIQLLEFEKAASVLDALKKSAADPIIRENSGQLLGLLADRGLIAK